jgi:excisionase family DNA binding protein
MANLQHLLDAVQRLEEKIDANHVEWLDITQAAAYLHLSRATVYGLTSRSLVPHFKPGKKLSFKRSDLDQYLSRNRVRTLSEVRVATRPQL